MGILKHIYNTALLNESMFDINNVNNALENHNVVIINYESRTKDTASGERVIYPTTYGLSTANNEILRAYQPEGDTESSVPSWKTFRLDGITSWNTTGEHYTTRDLPNLKLTKDKSMSTVFKTAFGGSEKIQPKIDSTPITKKEVENPDVNLNPTPITTKSVGDGSPKSSSVMGIDKNDSITTTTTPISKSDIEPNIDNNVSNGEDNTITQVNSTEPVYNTPDNSEDKKSDEDSDSLEDMEKNEINEGKQGLIKKGGKWITKKIAHSKKAKQIAAKLAHSKLGQKLLKAVNSEVFAKWIKDPKTKTLLDKIVKKSPKAKELLHYLTKECPTFAKTLKKIFNDPDTYNQLMKLLTEASEQGLETAAKSKWNKQLILKILKWLGITAAGVAGCSYLQDLVGPDYQIGVEDVPEHTKPLEFTSSENYQAETEPETGAGYTQPTNTSNTYTQPTNTSNTDTTYTQSSSYNFSYDDYDTDPNAKMERMKNQSQEGLNEFSKKFKNLLERMDNVQKNGSILL